MDVRSIEAKPPIVEHNGTVPVWWMIESREFKDITDGGFLELVNEFEVPGGGLVDPHSHPTHEFYYVMNGKGVMTIDGEDREITQGDLVYIPPNTINQHFNADPDRIARIIVVTNRIYKMSGLNDLEQLENAPEYKAGEQLTADKLRAYLTAKR